MIRKIELHDGSSKSEYVNINVTKASPAPARFFFRRIGGTLFKVRVYTGSGYADTLDEKCPV